MAKNQMSKNELLKSVCEASGVTRDTAESVIECFADVVLDAMVQEKSITIQNFGTFETSERSARKGRNPATGEEIEIAAMKTPKFRPSQFLKDAVNGKN